MPQKERTKELAAAVKAAREAGKIQLDGLRESAALNIEKKSDRSPVTAVDKACEARIREILLGEFPNDAFLGEETGETGGAGAAARRWIVDPLDGTRPFIRGIPTHSALVALEEDGVPTVGVIHLPALGLTCCAERGGGAFLNDEQIRVSQTSELSEAMGSVLGITEYAGSPPGDSLIALTRSWDYTYGFMDAYSYVLLACGKLDACVNLLDKPWDCAAAACIAAEAGGQFSSISGERTVHGGSIVLTNGILHDAVAKFFKPN
jgi:histidinol phosphatase-like enzyme (inositol monophosphatase family)